jgi:SpoIID/LytB domain protein
VSRPHHRFLGILLGLVSLAAAGCNVPPAVGAAASKLSTGSKPVPPSQPAAGPTDLVLDGRGYGHGVGLSQWGAYGLAVHGTGWQQIVAHYYGGTTRSTSAPADFAPLPKGTVSVRLGASDGRQTIVTQPRGSARVSADPRPSRTWAAVAIRELPGKANRYRVWGQTTPACPKASDPLAAPWVVVADNVAGPVTVTTAKGDLPSAAAPDDLLGLCGPSGEVTYYRGALQAVNDADGADRTVSILPIELYLRSVVVTEMSGSWGSAAGGAGMNALRAQAVAARSYALSETSKAAPGLKYPYAKTCDTTACQSYRGVAIRRIDGTVKQLEDKRATAAVDDTAGVILRGDDGRASRTYFSASNGGRTAVGPFPVVDDPEDAIPNNPNHTWHVVVPAAAVQSAWPELGPFTGARVVARDGSGGAWGGRATKVELRGTNGTITVDAGKVRTALGLKSTWFDVAR